MAYERQSSSGGSVVVRAVRVIVPWIALGLVVLVLWTLVSDYRNAAKGDVGTGSSAEATGTADGTGALPYVLVLSEGLNLRAEPSTTAAVVKVLNKDQQMVLVEEGVGWYHVRDADGTEGWVAAGGRYTQLVTP